MPKSVYEAHLTIDGIAGELPANKLMVAAVLNACVIHGRTARTSELRDSE